MGVASTLNGDVSGNENFIRDSLEVFGGVMACLPFFFYFLKIILKNSIHDEREILRQLFIDRNEYNIKHQAIQEQLQASLAASEKNTAMLQAIIANLGLNNHVRLQREEAR